MNFKKLSIAALCAGFIFTSSAAAEDVLIPVCEPSSLPAVAVSSLVVSCQPSSLPLGAISSGTPQSAFSAFSTAWIGWEAFYGLRQTQTRSGFNVDGWALGEYQSSSLGWNGHYIAAQKDLSYAVLASGVYLGFGLVLDVFLQPGYTNIDPLLYLFADLGLHRVTLGYSKDAWNTLVPSGPFGYGFLASVAFYQHLLRVDANFNGGNTRISGSIDENGDIAGAFTHRYGNALVFGALQYLTSGGFGLSSAILGAEYQALDRLLLFAAITHLAYSNANIYAAGATYRVNDRLEVSGGVEHKISPFSTTTALVLGIQLGLLAQTVAYANYKMTQQSFGLDYNELFFGVKSQF